MPQRIWRKEGARLHDQQRGTAERGDERQAWPVERERLPAAENSVLAFSLLGNPEIAEKTSYLHAAAILEPVRFTLLEMDRRIQRSSHRNLLIDDIGACWCGRLRTGTFTFRSIRWPLIGCRSNDLSSRDV